MYKDTKCILTVSTRQTWCYLCYTKTSKNLASIGRHIKTSCTSATCAQKKSTIYWWRPLLRSLLSSLLTEFLLGGEFPGLTLFFLDLLNFAMSSPKTSPVLSAEIRSSNSPFASLSPFFNPKLLLNEDSMPSLLCFRSNVSFLSSASCFARFSSSSWRFFMFSLSWRASESAVRKVSKMPKNSSGWMLAGSSPKRRTALSKRVCKQEEQASKWQYFRPTSLFLFLRITT